MRIQFIVLVALIGCSDSATSTVQNQIGDACEEWEVDPTPTQLFPVDRTLRTFTLDDCVTINACEPSDPVCGNGIVEGTEQCDDGNTNPFDGCDMCIVVDTTPDKRDTSDPAQLTASSAATTLSITGITANEPIVVRSGTGYTYGADAVIVDSQTFKLRADVDSYRNDRTYSVRFVDQDGNAGACTFVVPRRHSCGH